MYLGMMHEAFGLTMQEQLVVSAALKRMLKSLRIPERGTPKTLPLPLVMEYQSGYYSRKLTDVLEGRAPEVAPMATAVGDHVVPPEAWRASLMQLMEIPYPDLLPEERLAADKIFADILSALGLPERRARFLPRDVQITQAEGH